MNKLEFILALNEKLSVLPKNEREERINFYVEMIEDRIEEGLSEEEAVSSVGNVDEIVEQIVSEIPLSKIAKERIIPKRKIKAWEIVLLVLGFPLWLPLLIAAASVILAVYVVLWSVIITLWSSFAALICSSVAVFVLGLALVFGGKALSGVVLIGASLVGIGVSIFLFFCCKWITNCLISLTKNMVIGIKNALIKKGDAQ